MLDRDELTRRLAGLPSASHLHTVQHAGFLTAGEGHDRFDFTVGLMVGGLLP